MPLAAALGPIDAWLQQAEQVAEPAGPAEDCLLGPCHHDAAAGLWHHGSDGAEGSCISYQFGFGLQVAYAMITRASSRELPCMHMAVKVVKNRQWNAAQKSGEHSLVGGAPMSDVASLKLSVVCGSYSWCCSVGLVCYREVLLPHLRTSHCHGMCLLSH